MGIKAIRTFNNDIGDNLKDFLLHIRLVDADLIMPTTCIAPTVIEGRVAHEQSKRALLEQLIASEFALVPDDPFFLLVTTGPSH